jgi:hypothetical protein
MLKKLFKTINSNIDWILKYNSIIKQRWEGDKDV